MLVSKSTVRITLIIVILIVFLYFFWMVRNALYPFIIGLFLTYLLNPAVCYLERKNIGRLWAIIIIYIILFSVVIIGGSKLLALFIKELQSFALDLPIMIENINKLLIQMQSQYQNSALPYYLRIAIDDNLLLLENEMQDFIGQVVNFIIKIISHSIGLAISPILAFYLLHDWYKIKSELLSFVPSSWRTELILFFRDADTVLGGIIRGQLLVACIIGVFVTIGLYFLQVKFAIIIGILAALFDVIPYFGPIIGASPAVMLAILESPWLTMKVILLFFIIQQIEGNIIHPKIIGENIGLHPLTVIFVVFVGGEVAGIIGMLLGVPVAAIGKVLIRHIVKVLL
ncbi:AI-2E family transporter [Pelosinus propionicus]|uniref:Predicted PurR-regulated permease PerM n=1 Tax=Pelosinus propionicus DSM 13327 TaxID=1123291 RepID=A0A1I4KS47_9FIRM|nr:AI-2E family transporter [Pelosinus propionicus]SFL81575.1 Predicted PurR-regulated permease PerM [Pelosinus propionicus DSM 13327]